MKKQRNQPDRAPFMQRFAVRLVGGTCPAGCDPEVRAVIYRRSNTSITFRCNQCSLQWMITLANLHKAAKRLANDSEETTAATGSIVATATAFALEREAARRSSINRQIRRRVILLPDSVEKFNVNVAMAASD